MGIWHFHQNFYDSHYLYTYFHLAPFFWVKKNSIAFQFGKQIAEFAAQEVYPINNLASGLYFVRIVGDSGVSVIKLMVR